MSAPLAYADSWTPDRVELLMTRWLAGDSCAEIAAAIGDGITRNAVLGKIKRLKLPGRLSKSTASRAARHPQTVARRPGDSGGGQYRRTVRAHDIAVAKQGHGNAGAPKAAGIVKRITHFAGTDTYGQKLLKSAAWEPVGGSIPIPIASLTLRTCRWPIGDHPILFCGCDVEVVGKPYCATHRARSRGDQ